jgi:hypothetical protein
VLWRYLANSFANGQINIPVAFLALYGCWLACRKKESHPVWGGIFISFAACLKATPLLFLAVPVLHRKWKAVFAFGISFIIIMLLTTMWFGIDISGSLWEGWNMRTERMARVGLWTDRVISTPEFILSIVGASGLKITDSGIRVIWFHVALLIAISFFIIRKNIFTKRGIPVPAIHDTAMIALLSLLLSPKVRKAHMIHGLFPYLVLLIFLFSRKHGKPGKKQLIHLLILSILFIGGISLDFEELIPGYEANFTLFLALLALVISFNVICAFATENEEANVKKMEPTEESPIP